MGPHPTNEHESPLSLTFRSRMRERNLFLMFFLTKADSSSLLGMRGSVFRHYERCIIYSWTYTYFRQIFSYG